MRYFSGYMTRYYLLHPSNVLPCIFKEVTRMVERCKTVLEVRGGKREERRENGMGKTCWAWT